MESTRRCRECEEDRLETEFYRARLVCKHCQLDRQKGYRKIKGAKERRCRKCKEVRPANSFRATNGYCQPCRDQTPPREGAAKGGNIRQCFHCKRHRDRGEFKSAKKYAKCRTCRLSHRTPPSVTVDLQKGYCSTCDQHKPNRHFVYNPKHHTYGRTCEDCREDRKSTMCGQCGETKVRKDFTASRWKHRRVRVPICTDCAGGPGIRTNEHHAYDYRFARDIAGMTHEGALRWLMNAYGGEWNTWVRNFGPIDDPKPYEPYAPDPIAEIKREPMQYADLEGRTVEGTVWCEGPKHGTVWVIRPDGSSAVVNVTKKAEVEYEQPQFVHPVPAEVLQTARDVLENYSRSQRDLRGLGQHIQPIGQDYAVAAMLLRQQRAHEKSRKPFLDTRPDVSVNEFDDKGVHKVTNSNPRMPVSMKRLRELTKEDIER